MMPALLLALALSFAPGFAASTSRPHPHQGVAPKFRSPTAQSLTEAEVATLTAGKAVRKQIRYETGGRGIAIMDIQGSPEQVWAVIDDYGSYPRWIDMLQACEVYGRQGNSVKVRFLLNVMGKDVEYFIDHDRRPDLGYVTWQLDYSRESDIDDSTGYWLVYPAPGREGFTRVEYTVDLRLSGWVPSFVEDLLARKGLEKATSWVKLQVEK